MADYSTRESFAEEPDYSTILEEMSDEEDGDEEEGGPSKVRRRYRELEQLFRRFDIIGAIECRSEPGETQSQVDIMLQRLGVSDFDWSFVDILSEHGDGTELANQNFLTLLRDELAKRNLAFVHLQTFGDSYGFAVIPSGDYASIAGMERDLVLNVSHEFGADEGYKKGRRILMKHRSQ